MKFIRLILFTIIFSSCKTHYLITPQAELKDSPCKTSQTGVNVRIKNIGKIAFTKIAVIYDDKEITFSGLNSGDSTCYKNLPSLWANNSVIVFFSKQPEFYIKLMGMAIDHVSEKQIINGYATINIKITEAKGQLSFNENVTLDKELLIQR
ncbi:hypothetical protein NAF17_07610 [Mucilaginibacter sp. RB4R14]|uniref:hypothetical protein n=1 Tax=Mucilaginibacter aurantiaciroseus TaxID=2949308 RepID=UPI0020918ED5|nr:hypothetical protein [Mucilaginibacter aurantiaciroseus]MCO5935403.1 hypothetical protein [Mucilaginibacter aurantiaciroseus]